MELIATPDNPVPSGAHPVGVATSDGLVLRAAWWSATAEPARGTICILQGRAEFIEKYFEVVTELRQRGFAVLAFDWRGQGGSGREVGNARKGHVRDFSRYGRDLEAIREQILEPRMPKPYFGLAHSMGAALALWASSQNRLPFERLVALTPMVALRLVKRPRLASGLALILNTFGFGKSFVPGGGEVSITRKAFAGNRLTSDPRRYARNAAVATAVGAGAVGDPTVAWVCAAFRFMRKLADPRLPRNVRTPTLVIAAGADAVCNTSVIEQFAARLKAGHAIVIPGARHEILMEKDRIREEFWAAFDAFIPGTAAPDYPRSAIKNLERDRMEAPVAGS